ncbi:uncharacterized protein ASPGLDRAFT_41090 [Aspergillus glaucus CBS 516.65]|uniref:Uncharacterized protein n=1 Tax=Aspergillus glaucus CBS 516.65 TaxID=1160497 RepID=A0A1L9VZ68_ASPGL|nr:hypothetical protein ASPGLDRAFT_41090 [Aspergillus glaucus CBS 516.65]OJJ89147.1 hypothetical protein ASPGLDRAFT_41090 [Aspergillus glaucus CBS 516.65]
MPGKGRLYLSCLESIRNRIIVLQSLKKARDALGVLWLCLSPPSTALCHSPFHLLFTQHHTMLVNEVLSGSALVSCG